MTSTSPAWASTVAGCAGLVRFPLHEHPIKVKDADDLIDELLQSDGQGRIARQGRGTQRRAGYRVQARNHRVAGGRQVSTARPTRCAATPPKGRVNPYFRRFYSETARPGRA